MSSHAVAVTDASFDQEVRQAELPVLVDFWAEWCGPCKMVAPLLDQLAADYAGRLKVCKLDVDANPQTPVSFAVRGIPTLMLFKQGEPVATQVGALGRAQLDAFVAPHL